MAPSRCAAFCGPLSPASRPSTRRRSSAMRITRRPKPSFDEVVRQYSGVLPPPLQKYPRVSVVVCAYNAERTMDQCLASLAELNYPNYEVIVVNDGSSDRTLEIAESYGYCRIISQPNKGLS